VKELCLCVMLPVTVKIMVRDSFNVGVVRVFTIRSISMVACRGHREINTETQNKFTNYLLSKKRKI